VPPPSRSLFIPNPKTLHLPALQNPTHPSSTASFSSTETFLASFFLHHRSCLCSVQRFQESHPLMARILTIVLSTLLALAIVVSAARSFEETEYIDMVISPFFSSHRHQHQQRLHRPTPPPELEQQSKRSLFQNAALLKNRSPFP
jgi:hypothetical protein